MRGKFVLFVWGDSFAGIVGRLFLYIIALCGGPLSASQYTADLTSRTSFLVCRDFVSTVKAFLSFNADAVYCVFFRYSFCAVFPYIGIFAIGLREVCRFSGAVGERSPAGCAQGRFDVIPVFFIRLFKRAFGNYFMSAFIFGLRVVSFITFFVGIFSSTSNDSQFKR